MRALTFSEAEQALYRKRDLFERQLSRRLDPDYRTKTANLIGHTIDRAWGDLDRIYYERHSPLGPDLAPLPGEMDDDKFADVYAAMQRHIRRCEGWVAAANLLAQRRKAGGGDAVAQASSGAQQ